MNSSQVSAKSWLAILVLGVVWGGTFMVMDIALRGITPFWIAAERATIAALAMGGVWLAMGRPLFKGPTTADTWITVGLIGALSTAIPFVLLAWGLQSVSSGFVGVSLASVGLMVLPLSHFFVPGERMTPSKVLGMTLGFIGVILLIGLDAFSATGAQGELWGKLCCLAAASCYACSSILMRRLPAVDPVGLATCILIIGSALSIPAAIIAEGPPPAVSGAPLVAIVALGLLPTAAANLLRVWVVRSAGPVFMSLVSYQLPLWAVFFGATVLGEPLPHGLIFAMAFILAGMVLSQRESLQRLFLVVR